ncbi:MAG: MFS transporter [Myxococcales bacterium]|nr:MFS transporter [Myxococcales bacterium]MBL0195486.1 MFS transporter [Myxococcales bacterium]HQY64789.1 MFS transporter [Polyangiaceae bacterium]
MTTARRAPHPVVWTILYLPFGAFSGFVTVALTFLATKKGLSISEGALLNGAQMLIQWLKWIWAPAVDVTLTPRKWYVLSTSLSASAILAMSAIPLGPSTLGVLLLLIAAASFVNSVVGMAIEAMIGGCTAPEDAGRVSAWFQAGNLGGAGLGGALGLFLIVSMPSPWMAGAIMGGLFLACCGALRFTPNVDALHEGKGPRAAVVGVVADLRKMLRSKGGLLSAILCVMPIGTGAAQVVLTQGKVAQLWGAGEREVELLQGLLAGLITTLGCFAGGWVCHRVRPRTAYAGIGIGLAIVATGMALSPATVTMYVAWSLLYSFGVGLAYAAFTAVVIHAMGKGSGATKYNIFASLSNFPIWWLGLVLGVAAQRWGPRSMLLTEAAFAVVAVVIVAASNTLVGRSKLPEMAASE